jgi:hypothetical protein
LVFGKSRRHFTENKGAIIIIIIVLIMEMKRLKDVIIGIIVLASIKVTVQ